MPRNTNHELFTPGNRLILEVFSVMILYVFQFKPKCKIKKIGTSFLVLELFRAKKEVLD